MPKPKPPQAHLIFAHGAGAGMDHPWMQAMDQALQTVQISTTRYNFPYMRGPRRPPDKPAILTACVRDTVQAAANAQPQHPKVVLLAGGKSLGGRMTAYAQAQAPLPHVRGLIFFGFPLHPPKKVSTDRAKPLADIEIPMLFLQGSRDALADRDSMREVCDALGKRATLIEIAEANHGFGVPKRTGFTEADIQQQLALAVADWFAAKVK